MIVYGAKSHSKLTLLLVLLCFFVFKSRAALTDEQQKYLQELSPIKICVDPDWMPFEKINNQGNYEGMLADYTQLISQHIDTPFVLYPTKVYSESRLALERGDCHLIVADAPTESTIEKFLITKPYFISTRAFAIHADAPFISDFTEIADRPTGVTVDSPAELKLKQLYPNANIVPVANVDIGLQKVSSGELYSFVSLIGTMTYSVQSQSLTDIKIGGALLDRVALAMLVNKQYPQLIEILNEAIDKITQQDRKIIFEKWIAVKFEQGFDWLFFWQVIGTIVIFASGIITTFVLSNRKLRQEIQRRKDAELIITKLAMTDQLTGLANRNKFFDKLTCALKLARRQKSHFALAMIDLDDFKLVNDQYGHPAGDALLRVIASRLEDSCRDVDTVARLGGDEFSIIMISPIDKASLAILAERILTIVAQPIDIGGVQVNIGLSIGFTIYPEDGDTDKILISKADQALYNAKGIGKNTYIIYD